MTTAWWTARWRPVHRILRGGLVLLLLYGAGCSRDTRLATPPAPDLAGAEPQVAGKIRKLQEAVRAAPDSAASWGRLAMNYDVHDFKDAAKVCYEQAIARDSLDFRWIYYDALLLAAGGRADAAAGYRRALKVNPAYVPLRLRYGTYLLETGDLDGAARQFSRALTLNAGSAHARLGLARIALQHGQLARSRQLAQDALAQDSTFREAYGLLAEILRRQQKYREAEKMLSRVQRLPAVTPIPDSLQTLLEAEGASALWYRTRGEALLDRGRLAEAAAQFRRAMALKPDAAGYVFLGDLYVRMRDDSSAVVMYRRGLERSPNAVETILKLGRALLRRREFDAAGRWCEQGLRLAPAAVELYEILANSFLGLNGIGEAIAAYRRGLVRTRSRFLASRLAWLLATARETKWRNGRQALQLIKPICERTKFQAPQPLEVLAAAQAAIGNFPAAIKTAEQAQRLARQQGNAGLARKIAAHLRVYRSGQPLTLP